MKTVLKALIILFVSSPVFAEDSALPYDPVKEILNSRNKSTGMQGASWNTPEDKTEKESEENKESAGKDTEKEEKSELWNRYKEAENNAEEKQHEPSKENAEGTKDQNSDQAEAEKKTNQKPKTGLAGILEKYKNSQKDKGGMSSRSFGNLDR